MPISCFLPRNYSSNMNECLPKPQWAIRHGTHKPKHRLTQGLRNSNILCRLSSDSTAIGTSNEAWKTITSNQAYALKKERTCNYCWIAIATKGAGQQRVVIQYVHGEWKRNFLVSWLFAYNAHTNATYFCPKSNASFTQRNRMTVIFKIISMIAWHRNAWEIGKCQNWKVSELESVRIHFLPIKHVQPM